MSDILFEKGSPAFRVCAHLQDNPSAMLSRRDLANLLQIVPGGVDAAVEPAVMAGCLISANDVDLGRCWRAGPNLRNMRRSAFAPSSTPAAKPATQAGVETAPTKPARKLRPRLDLPPLELAQLRVSADVPLPMPAIAMKGQTKHDALFASLAVDGMSVTGIPIAYQAALLKATQAYLNHHPEIRAVSQLFVRRTGDATCGIWRVTRSQEDDTNRRHRVRRANKLRAAA